MSLRRVTDGCGREVAVPARPQRIACLCPSLSETLVELGLPLVGRTRYCIHPQPAMDAVAIVGGTKQIDMQALQTCAPDLIIAEKEENRREDVEAMSQQWPVYVCDIQNISQAHAAIARLGELGACAREAQQMRQEIELSWARILPCVRPLRVLYLIWRKPWMAAGRDTYIDAVLQRLGMSNVAADLAGRYPQITAEQMPTLDVDVCLLSSEPFPFAAQHQAELAPLLPGAHSHLVDGEMFSWYGARMLPAAAYLSDLVREIDTLERGPS